jgi:undecaprenyl-diphosphatase
MNRFDIIAIALIQGITEFLPISSSGHLALWPILTGHPDQGITMDVAVHMGTLTAVCVFFRREAGFLLTGLAHVLRGNAGSNEARGFLLVAMATIPAVIAGLFLKVNGLVDALRTLEIIGWATLLGGILLWVADRVGPRSRDSGGWTLNDAILMGLAQALALVPGTSRSGITMTMARFLGFERADAARLSMMMAMPIILAAGTLETFGLIRDGNLAVTAELGLGAVLSFFAALGALSVMMRMFSREWTMLPFVIYRLVLGVGLLGIAYW